MPGSSAAATTWRWSRPTIRKPVTAVAVFTQNKFVAPPVMLDRAAARGERRQGERDHRQFGQRQCRHRQAGHGRRRGDGRGRRRRRSASTAATFWSARPGSSARRLPMDVILKATPKLAKKLSREGGEDAATGILTTDTGRQAGGRPRLDLHARRHGQGLRHDRAQHGDDARLPHHRRRAAARHAPADPARRRRPHLQHAQRRRRDLDQRHRDPARQRPARQGRPDRVRRRGPQACARTSPIRWRRTPRA